MSDTELKDIASVIIQGQGAMLLEIQRENITFRRLLGEVVGIQERTHLIKEEKELIQRIKRALTDPAESASVEERRKDDS